MYTKRHLGCLHHVEKSSQIKNKWYIWVMWATFQRLPIGKICCIGKDMSGFVRAGFFEKKRFH
jgi:hypothetical protein